VWGHLIIHHLIIFFIINRCGDNSSTRLKWDSGGTENRLKLVKMESQITWEIGGEIESFQTQSRQPPSFWQKRKFSFHSSQGPHCPFFHPGGPLFFIWP
jgi:hypothetical protein